MPIPGYTYRRLVSKIPGILKAYNTSNFTLQLKTRVFFNICIAAIFALLILIASSTYVQLHGPENKLNYQILIPIVVLLIVFIVSLFLLINGKFNIASHLFLISANICVWYIMFFSGTEHLVVKLDTIFLILAIISSIPLFIHKYKSTIIIYVVVNLAFLLLFVQFFKNDYGLTNFIIVDYVVDTSIAILLIGVAAYQIVRINNKALNKVEADYRKRIHAEKALKESEENYRTLMENLNEVIMMVDIDDRVQYVNKKFTEKLGYTLNEIKDKIGYELLIEPNNHEIIKKANQQRIKKEKSQYELTFIAKNGNKIDFLINGAPVLNDEGKAIGSIGAMVDISHRKMTERALKESEEKYREMAELLPIAIWETDLQGVCTYTNKVGLEIHGFSYADLVSGINVLNLITPEEKEKASRSLKNRISGVLTKGEEYTAVKKDGAKFPARIYTSVVYKNGKPVGFRGVTVDITEAKKTEKQLKESEEKYRTIIEAFPDIIMISDLDGNIIFGNSALEKITGITPKDYNNPKRKAHIHPDDLHIIQNATHDLLEGNQAHTDIIENRFIDKWGNIHWFSGIMSKLVINNETFLQTITRDVTDKKYTEQELEKYRQHLEFLVQERTDELATANEELKSTNEELLTQREELEAVLLNLQNAQKQLVHSEKMASLGVLASGIAHEINNPLNFIKGGVFGLETYLKENLEEHLDELNPLLDGINEGVNRAASIVTSLNHYNRKDDSKMTICDIHSIIDNCLTILQNQLKDQIKVNKKYTRKKHILNANEGKLHQAILNILSNAIQSINNTGTITIKTGIKGNELKLQISDTGCGIKADDLHKIMDPFYTTKEPGKGTGLGLSITHNILQEHNASIEFNSKINKGTTVLINIPLNKN